MAETRIVVFNLNGQACGVDTDQVIQILKYYEPNSAEQVAECFDGVIDLRGNTVPVMDLNKRFGSLASEPTKKTKIIISSTEIGYIGYIVDDVSEIMVVEPNEMEQPPEFVFKGQRRFIRFVAKKNDRLIPVYDFANVLSAEEIATLQGLSA